MRYQANRFSFGACLGLMLIVGLFASPSYANINIQIGMSKGDVVRILLGKGYSQIQVHDTGFKTGKAYACKDGLKYNVKVDIKGRIKGASKIGNCRNQVSEKQVRRNLQANGFTRIVIDEQNSNYIAIGCKGTQRTRLIISQQGQLVQRRNIGKCQEVLVPSDIRQVLRDKGYNRISFTDRQLPRYVAEACLQNRKMELVINRFGKIAQEKRIGRCNPPIDPKNLVKVLRDKGYNRVSVISGEPPRYQVEACAQNARFEVTLNRFGTITERNRIGQCNAAVNKKQIAQILRDEGFTRININQRANGNYRIFACFEGYEKRIKLSQYGELLEEVDGNACKVRSIHDVRTSMRDNGFKGVKLYVEGCRNGNKVRITLNQFGDRIGRERIGTC